MIGKKPGAFCAAFTRFTFHVSLSTHRQDTMLKLILPFSACLPRSMSAPPIPGRVEDQHGTHHAGTLSRQGAANGGGLPAIREGWFLRRHRFPSRHSELHDPGRRFRRTSQKKTRGPVKSRSRQRTQEHRRHRRHARTPDPHSATAQFFINTDNDFLDFTAPTQQGHGYAVFGRVSKAWTSSANRPGQDRLQAAAPRRAFASGNPRARESR